MWGWFFLTTLPFKLPYLVFTPTWPTYPPCNICNPTVDLVDLGTKAIVFPLDLQRFWPLRTNGCHNLWGWGGLALQIHKSLFWFCKNGKFSYFSLIYVCISLRNLTKMLQKSKCQSRLGGGFRSKWLVTQKQAKNNKSPQKSIISKISPPKKNMISQSTTSKMESSGQHVSKPHLVGFSDSVPKHNVLSSVGWKPTSHKEGPITPLEPPGNGPSTVKCWKT